MIKTADFVSAAVELKRINANRRTLPVVMAVTMTSQFLFSYKQYNVIDAHFIFGGVDHDGPQLYSIYSDGFYSKEPYAAYGSGGYVAMSVLETRWRENMTEEDAIKLARDAVKAGIMNDLGSGSNVDLAIVRKDFHKLHRPYESIEKKGVHGLDYTFQRGTTAVLSVKKIDIEVVDERKTIF